MAAGLAGVDLKIGRAERHLADLKKAIETRFDADRYRFEQNLDPETGKHVVTAHGVPEIAPEWSTQLGDYLFNLRSALDHLAWQLVCLDGKKPGENTKFPVRDSPFNKKGKRVATQLAPPIKDPRILTALEEVQPYYRADGTLAPFRECPLWQLNKLNNIDKHRLLLVVTATLAIDEMWWPTRTGEPEPNVELSTKPIHDGSPVAWLDFCGAEPPPNFDPHPSLAVTLRETELPVMVQFVQLPGYLEMLLQWVKGYIIDCYFRPLFP